MRINHIFILLFFFLLGLSVSVSAQCDGCKQIDGFSSDYCYTSDLFPDHCASFSGGQSAYYVQSGKKLKKISGPAGSGMNYLLSLANNKKLKLKAIDILFVEQALNAWADKKVSILAEEAGAKVYTAEELQSMKYEYTDSGLGVSVIKEGKGSMPKRGRKAVVHYRGYLENGEVFDASYNRNAPFEFMLGKGQVIKGWDEGVALYNLGSRVMLKIPPDLAYGNKDVGNGLIPANSTLYFDVLIMDSK